MDVKDDDDDEYLEEFDEITKQQEQELANEDNGKGDDQFEESPRPKVNASKPISGEGSSNERSPDGQDMDDEDDVDEDEVIDVAEQIFVRIAEAVIKMEIRSVRSIFQEAIQEAEIDGQIIELISPLDLLEGIKAIGVDDLTEKEVTYLMRVLTKPELSGAIVMPEFLQIMENLGLYENEEGAQDELGQSGADYEGNQAEEQPKQKRKKQKQLDLSQLDQKSVKIMVMLMLHLMQQEMTTQEFFEEVIFEQNVKTKTKHYTMILLKSEDFFRVLQEKGIRSKATEHENLRDFLKLSADYPDLLLLKHIKSTLEQMAENEAFMAAIEEDVL